MTQTHINIAMLAHVDAGKTTLSEALLYKSGSIRKAGRVDNLSLIHISEPTRRS